MAFRIFDAEGRVTVDDDTSRGLGRVARKVQETVERVDNMEGTATLKADSKGVEREIEKVRGKLRSLDRQRANPSVDMDATQFDVAEKKLRAKLRALENERVEIDVRMGRDLKLTDRALVGLTQRLRGVGKVSPWRDIQRLGNALHNARITMGPLSLSLRGLIVAMLSLAPIVSAAVGTLGGLVSVVGQGLGGAIGIAGAALGGFGGLLAGMIGAVIAHKKQFAGFKDEVNDLGKAWKAQTRIPTEFFDAIREGLRSANALMPIFSNSTNRALRTTGREFSSLARELRSGGMADAFRQLMRNSNQALGPMLSAFGDLSQAAVRIGASFSRHLPSMTQGFARWASEVLTGTQNTRKLDGVVDELMKSLSSVGRLGASTGRLLTNFFMAGGRAGRGMLRDVTGLVDKWADWAGSAKGQRQINTFLEDSWALTKKVAGALGEGAELIGRLAPAMRPFVEDLLEAVTGVTKLANNFLDATDAADELVRILGGLWVLNRAIGWAGALARMLGAGGIMGGLFGGRGKGGGGGGILAGGGGAAAGRKWGSTFSQGAKGSMRNLLTAGALAGGGAAGVRAMGGQAGRSLAQGVKGGLTAGARLLGRAGPTAALMFFLDPGNLSDESRQQAIQRAGTRQADQFVRGVSKGLGVSREVAERMKSMMTTGGTAALRETQRQFRGIQQMVSAFGGRGRAILLTVAMTGDREVRARLMELVQTRLGRKLLMIAERGGREGIRMLGTLGRTKLGQKILNIVQRGGPAAQRIVQRLSNQKIRDKIVRILERGGPEVQGKLNRILGTNFKAKTQSIKENGWSSVWGKLNQISGKSLADKIFAIIANDQASGTVSMVQSLQIADKTFNIIARRIGLNAKGNEPGGTGEAAKAGDPVHSRIAAQAAAARALSPGGGKVSRPRMLGSLGINVVGEELGMSEFVIPTNPAYRGRAKRLLRQAIGAIAPRGFKRGGGPSRAYERPKKLRKVAKSSHPYLNTVKSLQEQIHSKDQELFMREGQYSTDSQFHPMVDDDGQRVEANIAWHVNNLDELARRAEKLMNLERQLAKATAAANTRLHRALDMIRRAEPKRTITKGRGDNKRQVDNPEWKKWDKDRQNFQTALGEVPESAAVDAGDRANQYQATAYGYRGDLRAAQETRSAPRAGAGMEGWLASQGLLGSLQNLNLGVAMAASTIGDTADDVAAQSGLAGFWSQVIQRLGPSGDPELLTEAYTNLAQSREAAGGGSGAPTIESQMTEFDRARTELFRTFGGNMATTTGGIIGAMSSGVTEGVVRGLSGGGGGSAGPVSSGGGGGGGNSTTVNQTNNFAAPPPDPHTFAAQVKWNAQAIV